ncbi:flavodoxin [Oenococcus alcoholitolerans]|uniref:Flavodoxin-like domain-containing protein n=1 Tax=Oenococcus alcoholitolerans TaxID=931074 RepID=A0ABR4XS48_9LACO|nr:hypothetical protein Q757_02155 [Oenococcus alcoholitolerans]
MKTKNRKFIFISLFAILFIAAAAFDFAQGSLRNQNESRPAKRNAVTNSDSSASSGTKPAKGPVLIVYFSRAGENDSNSNIRIGNTHWIANFIADKTKGDKYEIVPAVPYPKSYQKTLDRAESEQQRGARPKIKNKLPDIRRYGTIFLGYPIWWSELPMVVRTFMDSVDLNGKTVIPFSTNGGSGWADSLPIIRHAYPRAHFLRGFEIEGDQASHARKQVDRWLDGIGY